MNKSVNFGHLLEIVRFYQAALVNAIFGFGAYVLLVQFGFDVYLAQIYSHISGMIFNYFTYSRHVFRSAVPAKVKFVITYAVNYFIGLGILFVATHFFKSPYVLGVIVLIAGSVTNYFALKYFVFVRRLIA